MNDTSPPPGTTWTGDWDEQFDDRVYGAEPLRIGSVSALLTGVQHRNGSTVSGVSLRIEAPVSGGAKQAVIADLTPGQARELAAVLAGLAERAERTDGLR